MPAARRKPAVRRKPAERWEISSFGIPAARWKPAARWRETMLPVGWRLAVERMTRKHPASIGTEAPRPSTR
eukprot:12566581-Heterocapsa_arctica.AAC.1